MSSFIGVALAIVGNSVNSVGFVFQKKAHNKNLKLDEADKISYWKMPMWVFGFAVYVAGNVLNAAALAFAPQSVVTPLGSITLAVNTILAPLFLGEALSRKDGLGTVLIIGGACLIVIFGGSTEKKYTVDQLLQLYLETRFIVFGSLLIFTFSADYVVTKFVEKKLRNKGTKIEDSIRYPEGKFLAISYGSMTGFFSSLSVLFMKSAAELIKLSLSGENQFTNAVTYVFIVLLVFTNISQVHWMQKGLKYFDALFVVPVFQVILNILAILGGAVYFNEAASFDTIQYIVFSGGVLITILGIYLLSVREMKNLPYKEKLLKAMSKLRAIRAFVKMGQLRSTRKRMAAEECQSALSSNAIAPSPSDSKLSDLLFRFTADQTNGGHGALSTPPVTMTVALIFPYLRSLLRPPENAAPDATEDPVESLTVPNSDGNV